MAKVKLSFDIMEQIATMEAEALIEGLNDPELRANPAFLGKVRQFLKENEIVVTEELPQVQAIKGTAKKIPDIFKGLKVAE